MEDEVGSVVRREGRRGVTVKHVAERAGVSRATVSLVLRESPLVAHGTRERVRDAMLSAGYVYNRGAARLRTGSSGTIGLIVPEITNPFYAQLTAAIDDVLDKAGRLTFLANSNDRPNRQERFINRIREQGVDGIVLCAAAGTPPSLAAQMRAWDLPVVEILRTVGGGSHDFVAPDFAKGTRLAAAHLFDAGHTRIALLASAQDHSATAARIAAFRAAHRGRRLPIGPVVRCRADGATAAACLDGLLTSEAPPSAVICHNDLMALAVMQALRERGLDPGRDLRVVGFDDIPEASRAVPRLTTVATAPFAVGAAAAELLLRRLADPTGPVERILIEPELKVRAT